MGTLSFYPIDRGGFDNECPHCKDGFIDHYRAEHALTVYDVYVCRFCDKGYTIIDDGLGPIRRINFPYCTKASPEFD